MSPYVLDFGWLRGAAGAILDGTVTTLVLILVTAVSGTLLSILGALGRRGRRGAMAAGIAAYVELIRNTPFLVQLFVIFFGLPSLGIRLEPMPAAILAMTLNLAAYGTEIVGAGLDAVPAGQREAARALALRPHQAFLAVVLPQALKIIFPALTSQIVITMLESAVVSQIAVSELTYQADLLQARTFRAFETYLVVTLIYLGLSIALRRGMIAGGRRLLGPLA